VTARRRRGPAEAGITIPELLVVLTILSVLLAFVLTSFHNAQRAENANEHRLRNLDQARVLMATLSKDIRTATPLNSTTPAFEYVADRQVKFFADLNNNPLGGPNELQLTVDATGKLTEQTRPPDASSVAPNYTYSGPWTTRTIGQNIVGTAPVLQYFDAAGAKLSTANPTDPAVLGAVRSVEVDLVVSVPGNTGPPGSLVDRVRLPNVLISNP
jgi:prepilin-type N-terminal cleavage/methylation domain-containing protein